MSRRLATRWLSGLLWGLTLTASALLVGMVILAPLLTTGDDGGGRVLQLFARDALMRRTALASALGLLVTACVFFRSPPPQTVRAPARVERTPPPPIVGA